MTSSVREHNRSGFHVAVPPFVWMAAGTLIACAAVLFVLNLQEYTPALLAPALIAILFVWFLLPPMNLHRWRELGKLTLLGFLFIDATLDATAPLFTFSIGHLAGFWLRIISESCLLLTALVLILKRQAQDRDKSVARAYLMLLAWAVFVALFRSPLGEGIPAVLRLSSPFGCYMLAVACLRTPEDGKRALKAIVGSSLLVVPIALYQLLSGNALRDPRGYLRLTGPYLESPTTFALYLLVVLFVLFALLADRDWLQQGRSRGLFLIGLLTAFLFLTETRTAWVALGVGWSAISWLRRRRRRAVLILVLPLLLALLVPAFQRRASELTTEYTTYRLQGQFQGSLGFRLEAYQLMLSAGARSPLWGHGFGSFAALFESTYGIPKVAPHNDFLYLFFESGIIGLGLYVCYLWALTRVSWSFLRGVTITASVAQAAFLSLFIIDFLLFFQNPLFCTSVQDYVFALVGISSAYVRIQRQQAETHRSVPDGKFPNPEASRQAAHVASL